MNYIFQKKKILEKGKLLGFVRWAMVVLKIEIIGTANQYIRHVDGNVVSKIQDEKNVYKVHRGICLI